MHSLYEAYSLVGVLKHHLGDRQIKVWSIDSDLLKISNAPNTVFSRSDVPEYLHEYLVEGTNGYSFETSYKECILFEFSDVRNASAIPRVHIIVARDIVSFLKEDEQHRILNLFEDKLKPGGILVLGDNEAPLDGDAWEEVATGPPRVFRLR
jgi:purine-binding chemotaxis protein CheW